MHALRHAGMRQLRQRNPDVQQLRAVGHVHGGSLYAQRLADMQLVRHADMHRELLVGRLLVPLAAEL